MPWRSGTGLTFRRLWRSILGTGVSQVDDVLIPTLPLPSHGSEFFDQEIGASSVAPADLTTIESCTIPADGWYRIFCWAFLDGATLAASRLIAMRITGPDANLVMELQGILATTSDPWIFMRGECPIYLQTGTEGAVSAVTIITREAFAAGESVRGSILLIREAYD